ncbi:MAG TPA: hypothetical protein VK742_12880, partial [Candidatus Sulfotelmatobacter sp.]|nr:hypothetical protein [Candidatus Sulfotelmatobacter sp.]
AGGHRHHCDPGGDAVAGLEPGQKPGVKHRLYKQFKAASVVFPSIRPGQFGFHAAERFCL